MLRTGYSVGDLVTAEQFSDWQQRKSALRSLSTQVVQVRLALLLCERLKHVCVAQHAAWEPCLVYSGISYSING